MALIFSAQVDESGTDGRAGHTVLAGAVALPIQWDRLESNWGALLKRNGVAAFHSKEFKGRSGCFAGWSDFKRKRFTEAQAKIIYRHTAFQVAVLIENATHDEIKKKMVGVKTYQPDSHYGMCFRVLMFRVCGQIEAMGKHEGFTGGKVQFLLESGPWGANAAKIYEAEINSIGSWRQSVYAHMLDGFGLIPKGKLHGLEAADFLAAQALDDFERTGFLPERDHRLGEVLDRPLLLEWHKDMLKEKERQRAHRQAYLGKKPAATGAI